jgi:hypothetical protein
MEIQNLCEKVHVHRWPMDSPPWDDSVKKELDDSINKNRESKKVIIKEKTILIENIEFYSLKKIGISVPFFKEECAIIFEAQFGSLFAHIHIHIKSSDYVDVFNKLISWKNMNFPDD